MRTILNDIISAGQVCKIVDYTNFVVALNREIVKAAQNGLDHIKINAKSIKELQYILQDRVEIINILKEKKYEIKTNLFRLTEDNKDYWYVEIYWAEGDEHECC